MPLATDDELRTMLSAARTVAVVGVSDSPDKPSWGVMQALQEHGYRVFPVNPRITGEHVHGEFVWRELAQIGAPVDIVDIFRRSADVDPIVEQAIAVGARAVWMQLGIENAGAAARAEAAGLAVVMNKCLRTELRRLGVAKVAS